MTVMRAVADISQVALHRWRITSCAATVIAAMRPIGYASQVALRPSWQTVTSADVHQATRRKLRAGRSACVGVTVLSAGGRQRRIASRTRDTRRASA